MNTQNLQGGTDEFKRIFYDDNPITAFHRSERIERTSEGSREAGDSSGFTFLTKPSSYHLSWTFTSLGNRRECYRRDDDSRGRGDASRSLKSLETLEKPPRACQNPAIILNFPIF